MNAVSQGGSPEDVKLKGGGERGRTQPEASKLLHDPLDDGCSHVVVARFLQETQISKKHKLCCVVSGVSPADGVSGLVLQVFRDKNSW